MKILELDLRAFGPFTDHRLDLSGGREGLHLVFGPNEAGKSSALRALRGLLFGIQERTRDDFRHGKQELRLGGRLRNRNGEELAFLRRKGRKSTLLDPDGKAIGEDALSPFLGDVDDGLFERLFGIDYESLVGGGQTLLEERGREAEALFGAALGATAVRRVLDRLDQEANGLFLPRASKPRINVLIGELGETERRVREASLSVREWEQAKASLDRAIRELAAMDAEIAQMTLERSRLERIRRTLPDLVRMARLQEQLEGIGPVPVLAEDFAPRREEAVAKQARADEARANAQRRLDGLRVLVRELINAVSEDLLRESETIDDLRERFGSHRKAAQDRTELLAELARRESEASALLQQVRPDLARDPASADPPRLTPLLARRRRATDLGARKAAVIDALAKTRADLAETQERLGLRTGALAELPGEVYSTDLQTALDAARRAGDLDQTLIEERLALAAQHKACEQGLSALGLWSGGLADLLAAPLPDEESLRRFAEDTRALNEQRQALESKRSDTLTECLRCEEALRVLELSGSVPSEADLTQSRAHRDRGWSLVKRAWLGGEDVGAEARLYDTDAPLADAFEGALNGADEVADRLRREAGRVHERATTRARLEVAQHERDETERALADLTVSVTRFEEAWHGLWSPCGLTPLPPSEMLPWLARATRLRERIRQADEVRERIETREALRASHRAALLSALGALDTTLDPGSPALAVPELGGLIGLAEARRRAAEEGARVRLALEHEVAELQGRTRLLSRELSDAETAHAAWQADWTALMSELGLAPDAGPGEVSDDLQAIADAVAKIEAATLLRTRIAGIDRDAAAFFAQTQDCLGRLAVDLLGRPVEEAILTLYARLGEQRALKTRLEELRTQEERAEEDIRESETAIAAADRVLAELCRQAACEAPEQLPLIEERVRDRRRLAAELADVERALMRAGDGLGIEALAHEAFAVDQDRVVMRLAEIDARLEQELRPAHRVLIEEKADADRALKAMGGAGTAAALAEESQQLLAGIRTHAEQYVRLKLAARILRDEIERFRRQNSDPILGWTSRYFARLTCGAFSAVETDFDEADQPVLVGLRNSGERLRVEAMSTGTRDQLYLALRLANLEQYLQAAEPMPFVVDDILIQFDDERALATLATLADLSAKTQVILFSHHGRDIAQARKLDPGEERVWVHRLG
ncbi:YhaN family protein [Thiocapsa marina]|uniref:SMC domain protein n=1 Tax=Thiocapsa marina 5811 TaxID=768671 RepID=F9UEG7_9GAMM|nr:YhaN family protein [Thiocapsa marina]EGV17288.1 SMC domain protein [Thiocapsa marina 5811]